MQVKKVSDTALVIKHAKGTDRMFPQTQWAEVIRRVIQQKHGILKEYI